MSAEEDNAGCIFILYSVIMSRGVERCCTLCNLFLETITIVYTWPIVTDT